MRSYEDKDHVQLLLLAWFWLGICGMGDATGVEDLAAGLEGV